MDSTDRLSFIPLTGVRAAVERFAPVSLAEMTAAALLDRVDTKFTMTVDQLDSVLARLMSDYRVLSIDGTRICQYSTVYFDTPDFDIYMQHHNGWSDRYKVRARRYVDTNVAFFEIKHRTNRNRTIKSRIPLGDVDDALDGTADSFLDSHSLYHACDLEPKLWNDYLRITLVGLRHVERVTLDLNVAFAWGTSRTLLDGIVIAEVKQPRISRMSPFIQQMRRLGVRPASMSKYCTGVARLYPNVKSNNFKPMLRRIEKLAQGGRNASVA
ncbi:MAG: polyphosphate polymerase domain-containing protein [Chloroflexi bacterium]|nr:polyphosphate polymerase domain-containing protein [Chloroflexota bacterium]